MVNLCCKTETLYSTEKSYQTFDVHSFVNTYLSYYLVSGDKHHFQHSKALDSLLPLISTLNKLILT